MTDPTIDEAVARVRAFADAVADMHGDELNEISVRGQSGVHTLTMVDLRTILDAAADEMERLRAALDGIRIYCNDTLSGRTDGPDDRAWQRAAVIECRNRARAALKGATP